ncbi:iron complex transport system permease protein [Peteryoungia aggregata LMG 23059]|uniref:Iron complex transport system permease protein n=1 Tax=Peteryoungia aggregata LMG 23059 TaxID=1368425 RepID=A0ABU0GDR0_9HYPH|nr:iron chelate uptake ABC transporter family permease subunit [Peteryoungia aggregata]MDQ0423495.1 iron complex transport system permease protein [Peteryoungia aggregata LMG 23059]
MRGASTALSIEAGDRAASVHFGRGLVMALVGVSLLACLSLASLVLGVRPIAVSTVVDALLAYDDGLVDHIVIIDYRLPRTLLALLCGSAFGVSGALIQAVTRNPLADPGIVGVNAGAAFSVTLAIGLFGFHSIDAYLWFALVGAVLVTLAVYGLGMAGRGGPAPVRLVLAGVALSAVLGGIGSSITLINPQAFDTMRQWSIGSVAGRDLAVVTATAPFIGIGLLIALMSARALNAVALGEDLARSLGASLVRVRILTLVAVTLLAGAATAAVGPIGFIGLMVPHVVRWFTGPDQRLILPMTAIYAPVLLLAADIAGRLVLYPGELEAGVVTAFLGAPVLIVLARRKQAGGL